MIGRIYYDWLPPETLGQRLLRLRRERGLSLRQVQAKVNINISVLSRVERGHDVMISNLALIAKAFDMTPSQLLEGLDLSELQE